ncbi:ATP-binding protein [Streptomyces griseoincarnatus]|uniref:ATP-binding protein n=1 Tax=Streptomyces griseoincarnatus TaxID=29305 RepID=A0ABT0VS23_STRGI|nr:ATP-binding protein [Streptomyces griseoincarnatus]MCM2512738.1 ATP-binding protein [Streptomyces griseoincarnatus]
MNATSQYEMSVSLNVINHLGLNLYSNIPAVLSEAVANAWDADATEVVVKINKSAGVVTVQDNGCGMNLEDINTRYLTVGYRRRENSAPLTPENNRPVMGRKGIGKLSLFSIARVVEVFTVRDGEKHAFRMRIDDIKRSISDELISHTPYRPEPLDTSSIDFVRGTRIVLRDLKKAVPQAEAALRKRLARRFSVIDPAYRFSLIINDKEVSVEDRDYLSKLQYVWVYGDQDYLERVKGQAVNAEHVALRPSRTEDGNDVRGWIGSVFSSDQLREPGENLNRVVVLARGRLAHEDLLENISDSSFYRQYLIGELNAEFIDSDTDEDITTSSRQRLDEDDPRFIDLRKFFESENHHIKGKWGELRDNQGVATATENPAVREWFDTLHGDSVKRARALFGQINRLSVDDQQTKRELFAHAVLAFETLKYRDNLTALSEMTEPAVESFLALFTTADEIEANLYHRIVSQRLEVIERLQAQMDDDAKERVLQETLFDHLWLLDPAWERATDAHLEERIGTSFLNAPLTKEERDSRLDIRYKRVSGANVIIELKRYSVVTDTFKLGAQVSKYREALTKSLAAVGEENAHIEIVCIVGKSLSDWSNTNGKEMSDQFLRPLNARVITFDQLLKESRASYSEYLRERSEIDRIKKVIDSVRN